MTEQMNPEQVAKIMPMIEIRGEGDSELDQFWPGVRAWRAIADTVIVSTWPGNEERVFNNWVPRCQKLGMSILPGIKGWPIFGKSPSRLDDAVAWLEFLGPTTRAAELCDSQSVLIEMEGALGSWVKRQADIDLGRVRDFSKLMNRDVIMYPSVFSGDRIRRHRERAICHALGQGLRDHISWTACPFNRPAALHPTYAPDMMRAYAAVQDLRSEYSPDGAPIYHMVYTRGDDPESAYWLYGKSGKARPDRHVRHVFDHIAPTDVAVMYPHREHWNDSAAIVRELVEGGYPTVSRGTSDSA